MAQNYVLLERIELNASAASVTFSNIPQTGYTDLKMVVSARTARTDVVYDPLGIQFNGSTTGYSTKMVYGLSGSAASATSGATNYIDWSYCASNLATANTFGSVDIYIPNAFGSNYKSVSIDGVTENNGTPAIASLNAGLWSNTSAITSITFTTPNGHNILQYSTFSLYGIAAVGTTPAVAPKADGGNVIATDGTYWYHAFLSNGTFTPQVGLSADVLVVAGGGSGGGPSYAAGGGGGAGGLLAFTSQSLVSNSSYTCTVGAGAAGSASLIQGVNGTNSTFAALTAAVGGGGGGGGASSWSGSAGSNGGSGGGAQAGNQTGGSATSGQGYAGGKGSSDNNRGASGGGGGAGGIGGNGTNGGYPTNGGSGGAGVNTYSSWLSATALGVSGYIAGGGGGGGDNGGSGGSGGGGNGSYSSPTSGVANTGSGGGASSNGGTSGSGGSGIIIIRYAV